MSAKGVEEQGVIYTDMESALTGEYARYGKGPLYETRDTPMTINSQPCVALSGPAVPSSMFEGSFRRDPAAVLLPFKRRRCRTV